MTRAAAASPCYQASLASETCDFWQATLPNADAEQPLVPLRRHRRRGHGLLRRRHARASTAASARRATTRRPQLRADGLRAGFRRRPGRGTRSSTRSSPTASATDPGTTPTGGREAERPVLRHPGGAARAATAATTGSRSEWTSCPRALPRLRRRRARSAPAAPAAGRAARPRLLRRRPQGRRPTSSTTSRRSASRRSTSTRSSTPARTTATTRATTRDRPVLRHARPVHRARQAGASAGHPADPRRRLQPHVVRQPALRPLPPLRGDGRVRVGLVAVPARGSSSGTTTSRAGRRLRGLVRLRLDPGAR